MSCLKKRVLSPKKGILKRPANGCKGICMCLDCRVFRLRADRAFEFSRKQMDEADDIIGNLLEEVASLRSRLAAAEKKPSSGQQEEVEEACQRASRAASRTRRSRLVHQRNSFSYKRMLPFLMEDHEITSPQGGDRTKLQTVPEEKQLSPTHESDLLMASSGGHQLFSTLEDSAEAAYGAELERIVEEIASSPYENCLVKGAQLQSAFAEVCPGGSTAQVTPEVVLSSDKDGLTSDGDGLLPSESSVTEADRMVVEEKATESDENSVPTNRDLQPAASEKASPQEGDTERDATPKPATLPSDGDEATRLTSDKDESLLKGQPQLCDSKKLLQDNAELQQCQSSDVGFGSPAKAAMVDDGGADRHVALERHDSVASPDDDASLLLGVPTICCKPSSDSPSLEKRCLSPKQLSPVNSCFSGASCLKKRVLSPKKLSPKKGILKRPANGCKGICMCLDCSVFRLRADRVFEFSRKQMEEADDIIGNLLQEVASLRSLAAKPSSGQEQIEEACQRSSRVEEVARERQRQMQVALNAHCKIPGPRVKFAQYVDEKMAASSSPLGSSNSSRRQPPL